MDQISYLGYVRKSSEGDDRQAQSIETQIHILTEHAKKFGLVLVDIIQESRSAKEDGNRPMFDSLLSRLRSHEANGIFVAHIDRLARNGIEAGQLVKLFQSGVIKEIKTPSKTYNTVQDLLYLDIEFAFASDYSRRLSVRVKEGVDTKIRKGEYPHSAPMGYLNRDGKIYPDPERAPLIAELFRLHSTGTYSLSKITKYINEKGLRTKKAHKRVGKAVIHRILTNPLYYGMMLHYGKLFQGIHKPLISQELFNTCQEVLSGKRVCGKSRLSFLYRDYLICSVCGCRLTATEKKSKYRYYYCTNGKGVCDQHRDYLPESRVKELIYELLADFTLPGNLATASLSQYIQDLQGQQSSGEQVMGALRNEISATELQLKRLEDIYMEKRINPERYDERRLELTTTINDLKTKIKNYKPKDPQSTLELLEPLKNQAVNLHQMFVNGNDGVKTELLKSVLWNCKIMDGKIVSTRYKKPFAYFEGLSKTTDLAIWRRR